MVSKQSSDKQLGRNQNLKQHRKNHRCLETENAVRTAVKYWKAGAFSSMTVGPHMCSLHPDSVQGISFAPCAGTEVALFHGKNRRFVVGLFVRVAHTHGHGRFMVCKVGGVLCAAPINLVFEWI